MKEESVCAGVASYLDVSEYIIKEHSPLIAPITPQQHHLPDALRTDHTPEIAPIDHDTSQLILTPITTGLIQKELQDIMEDFNLERRAQQQPHRRRRRRFEDSEAFQHRLLQQQCELQKILEDDEEDSHVLLWAEESEDDYPSESEQQAWPEQQLPEYQSKAISRNTAALSHSLETEHPASQPPIQPSLDYAPIISKYQHQPELEIMRHIKDIDRGVTTTDQEKVKMLRQYLEQFVIDFEMPCFDQVWEELPPWREAVALIRKGITQTFRKNIGPLSFAARRTKLLKYIEKKKRRIWRKKVSYDCRKKVADGRLRIKGKFVTREQVCELLGMDSVDHLSPQDIRALLEKKEDGQCSSMRDEVHSGHYC